MRLRARRFLIALTLSAFSASAHADPLHDYFRGEKLEGIPFMTTGSVALALGAAFTIPNDDVFRGAAIPLLSIGVIELAAGIIVFTRTDAQVARLDASLATNAHATRDAELGRMHGVEREFEWLAITESVLLAGGVATAIYGFGKNADLAKGIGIGLAAQSTAMLTLDLLASLRADKYVRALARFQIGVGAGSFVVTGKF